MTPSRCLPRALTVDGKPGVKASYSQARHVEPESSLNLEAGGRRAWSRRSTPAANALPAEAASVKPLAIRWEATLTAPETGDYNLGMAASGFFRMQLDGKDVTSSYDGNGKDAKLGRVHLEAGKPAKLQVEYASGFGTAEDGCGEADVVEGRPEAAASGD